MKDTFKLVNYVDGSEIKNSDGEKEAGSDLVGGVHNKREPKDISADSKLSEFEDLICDNTDCKGTEEDKVFRVVLREEFESTTCNWCADCIRRDNDMIHTIINGKEEE